LRERKEDIALLTDYFLKEASEEMGKKIPTVPEELYTLLYTYHFPGNIRELRAMIYDAVTQHTSKKMSLDSFRQTIKINRENIPDKEINNIATGIDANTEVKIDSLPLIQFSQRLPTLKEAQELLVREAMIRAKNNQSIAAQILGITRQALNRRWREIEAKK
jgi:transcriptional regulator with PAS, ATPase and Fis domain